MQVENNNTSLINYLLHLNLLNIKLAVSIIYVCIETKHNAK